MQPRLQLAVEIIKKLQLHGHTALLVGGCVRDRLLGLEPKDFDVATSATPDQIEGLFPQSKLVGVHFGVSLVSAVDENAVSVNEGLGVEVATFRSEGEYSDGRRPDAVVYVKEPALDARRRDFTINGLFEDPLSGEIFDFVGGREDLVTGTIRAIGDARLRFREDHLRMLRAVRFAARFNFEIASFTLAAIREEAPKITRVSAERTRDELIGILTQGHARYGLELLDSSGLLIHLLPEVKAFQGVEQPPEFHPEGDVWTHVLMMLQSMGPATTTLALGVLFHDVAKPVTFKRAERIRFDGHAEVGAEMAENILLRLKFSNEDLQHVKALVANHMKFKDVVNMRVSTLKRFLRLPMFAEHLALHRLDCLASNRNLALYEFVINKLDEFGSSQLRPPNLVNGADLIALGYKPGPAFKVALTAVETAQLEGTLQTKEEALAMVAEVLGRV